VYRIEKKNTPPPNCIIPCLLVSMKRFVLYSVHSRIDVQGKIKIKRMGPTM